MGKMIFYMALGSAATIGTFMALENKMNMNKCIHDLNKKSRRTYKFIKGKLGNE